MPREIVASAPGKVNLHLGVGEARVDGYHDLVSVFHAVDRREVVRLLIDGEPVDGPVVASMRTTFFVDQPGEDIDGPGNLAWRAVEAVVARAGVAVPRVHIEVDKHVFVAGGMAGGSADAAAALVAANALVANLPYNVSVPVLLHLLAELPSIRRVLVMVQKEVADRLAAQPGSKIYGVPSVKAAFYGDVSRAGTIGKHVFWPAPNIESGLVRIDVAPDAPRDLRETVFPLVDAAFAQRRKTLRSTLSGVYGSAATAEAALREAGIDPGLRGEKLTVDDFIRLGKARHAA